MDFCSWSFKAPQMLALCGWPPLLLRPSKICRLDPRSSHADRETMGQSQPGLPELPQGGTALGDAMPLRWKTHGNVGRAVKAHSCPVNHYFLYQNCTRTTSLYQVFAFSWDLSVAVLYCRGVPSFCRAEPL